MAYMPKVIRRRFKVGFKGMLPPKTPVSENMRYASSCVNFIFENGCLQGYFGLDVAKKYDSAKSAIQTAPSGIKDLFLYKYADKDNVCDDRLVARLSDGTVWFTPLLKSGGWQKVEGLGISGDVHAVNYNFKGADRLLFCSPSEPLYMLEGDTPLYCKDAPHFSCFAIHGERLFGGVNGARPKPWFSADFDPFNWKVSESEAGFISFDDAYGDIVDVVSFLGHLYVFRKYAVFRLTAFGKQSEFSLKRLFLDASGIAANSICVCGDVIMFMAGTKMYAFDGYDVKQVAKNLPAIYSSAFATGAYSDGIYYLGVKIANRASVTGNDAILRYNVHTDTVSIYNTNRPQCLLTVKTSGYEQVFAAVNDPEHLGKVAVISDSGNAFGTATTKIFDTGLSTLGTTRQKVVRRISIYTLVPLTLIVKLDYSQMSFNILGQDSMQNIYVDKAGALVGVRITNSSGKANIPPLEMEVDFMKE